jgi:hypothetical protein
MSDRFQPELARNTKRLSRLETPGAGQVTVEGGYAYIGHLNPPHGTTIIDVSDPRKPEIVAQITLPDQYTHSHKVRVHGDLMITNYEQYNRYFLQRGQYIPAVRARMTETLGRPPSDAELAKELSTGLFVGGKKKDIKPQDIPVLDAARERGYHDGGFRVWDISDRRNPKLICHQRTGGWGCHRFDFDGRYAFMSTEMEGFHSNIIAIYDLADPAKPEHVSNWWIPGQHLAGGETPTWNADDVRVHHGLRQGNELWVACLWGGAYAVDISDIRNPRTLGHHNYHPPFPEPTHTACLLPFQVDGKRIALLADESQIHRRGQPHAGLWCLDVTDVADMKPLSVFTVSELDSPWSAPPNWFGAHQFQEHFTDTRAYCAWFAGGMRIVDFARPSEPEEVGWFVPEPGPGAPAPGTNDVDVDERGLVYLCDRYSGFDVVEVTA